MNLCAFCGHPDLQHMLDDDGHRRGCVAVVCEDKKENRGRCALFTSKESAERNDLWFRLYEKPVTVNPADVANIIHRWNMGDGEHSLALSCSCAHQAMMVLGLSDENNDPIGTA